MSRPKIPLVLAAVVALALSPLAAAEEMTLEELVAANIDARGGAGKIAAIETVRISAKMSLGGMEAPVTMEWKRPNMGRMEFTLQGQTAIQAFDGESGWMLMPFMGQTAPEQMPEKQAEQLAEQSDFEGPLVGWEEKGHQLEYLGMEDVEGTEAHKIKLIRRNGNVDYIFIDPEYFLEIKQSGSREMMGNEIEFQTTISDYKEVDGLVLPHAISSTSSQGGTEITIESYEFGVDLPDDHFAMPEAEAEEDEAAE